MLVLSRKIGEKIVLPGYEVTIEVLAVSRARVRIGVTAPSGIAVHRKEVQQRIDGREDSPTMTPRPARANGNGVNRADEDAKSEILASWIAQRTGGRIRSLSVEANDGRVVVHGRTDTYYARQLAQAAVSEALMASGGPPNEQPVDFDIQVVS